MNPSIYPSIIPADQWDRIMEYEFMPANGEGEAQQFFPAVGKAVRIKIQCKAAGLTGAEVKLCKAKMLTVCGRKPLLNKNKAKWFDCTQKVFVDYEKQVQGAATEPEDMSTDTGDGAGEKTGFNWIPYAIGGIVLIALVAGTIYVVKKGKAGKLQPVLAGKK